MLTYIQGLPEAVFGGEQLQSKAYYIQQLPAKDACFTTDSFNFFQDSYLCSNVGLSMWILGWNCERRSYLTACRSPRLVPVIRGSSMTERKCGTTLSFTMSRSLGQGSGRRPHLTPRLQAALRFDVLEVALALRVSQRSHGLTGSQDLKLSNSSNFFKKLKTNKIARFRKQDHHNLVEAKESIPSDKKFYYRRLG